MLDLLHDFRRRPGRDLFSGRTWHQGKLPWRHGSAYLFYALGGPFDGAVVRKAGGSSRNHASAFLGHIFWAMLPLFWLVASPRVALLWLGASSLLGGVASTAATTAANKLITRLPPPEFRAMYIAVSTSLASLAGGLGVVTAGTILHYLGDWTLEVTWFVLGAFRLLFIASLCLRLGSTLFLVRRIVV